MWLNLFPYHFVLNLNSDYLNLLYFNIFIMWQESLKQIFELGLLWVILPDKNYIDKVEYINKL